MRFLVMVLMLLAALPAGASFAQEVSSPGPRPYLEETTRSADAGAEEARVVLSQGDPEWASMRIGNGTVRSQGCLVISIAMVAMQRGLVASPTQMLQLFIANGLFTRTGNFYTSAISKVFPGLRIVLRTMLSASGFHRVEEMLRQGHDVLLKLDRDLRRAGIQQHWVRVRSSVSGDFIVEDPNGARVGTLRELYGSTAVVREMLVLGS